MTVSPPARLDSDGPLLSKQISASSPRALELPPPAGRASTVASAAASGTGLCSHYPAVLHLLHLLSVLARVFYSCGTAMTRHSSGWREGVSRLSLPNALRRPGCAGHWWCHSPVVPE